MKPSPKFRFFLLIFLTLSTSSSFSSTKKIIMLYGTGSSGRTSLSQNVKTLDPSCELIDEDDIYISLFLEKIHILFPKEFSNLKNSINECNLYHAIKRNQVQFTTSTTPTQRKIALAALRKIQTELSSLAMKEFKKTFFEEFEQKTLAVLKTSLKSYDQVLLDRWYISPETIKAVCHECIIKKVLVFATLPSTYQKFVNRNKASIVNANLYNLRQHKQFFPSYVRLYTLSSNPDLAIDACSANDIHSTLSSIRKSLQDIEKPNHIFISSELTLDEFDKLAEKLVPDDLPETVYIKPNHSYDFIIDTSKSSSKKCAQSFLNWIKST